MSDAGWPSPTLLASQKARLPGASRKVLGMNPGIGLSLSLNDVKPDRGCYASFCNLLLERMMRPKLRGWSLSLTS